MAKQGGNKEGGVVCTIRRMRRKEYAPEEAMWYDTGTIPKACKERMGASDPVGHVRPQPILELGTGTFLCRAVCRCGWSLVASQYSKGKEVSCYCWGQ